MSEGAKTNRECGDRNHEGLMAFIQGYRLGSRVDRFDRFGGPLPWMGQDVALLAHAVKDWVAKAHAAGMEAAARIAEEHQDHWDTGVPIQNHMPEPGDPPRCCVADAIRAAKPKP